MTFVVLTRYWLDFNNRCGQAMDNKTVEARCRLVLSVPKHFAAAPDGGALTDLLAAGDIASIIVPGFDLDEQAYQKLVEMAVDVTRSLDVAVLAVDDTRIAARAGADGIHVTGSQPVVEDVIDKFSDKMIVGVGGVTTRHDALRRAEAQPDYIYFGRFEKDIKPAPHPKNLEIATWWAQMVEIPCIVMGGNDVETLAEAASTGADFVALSHAVFGEGKDPAAMVARANALLEPFVFADD